MTIDPATAQDTQQVLLDSLLHSVSHDLRSPLLTMALSAELIETNLEGDDATPEGATVALGSLRQGAEDMERMLQTLMQLSRARGREIEPARCALQVILGGYAVTSDVADLGRRIALVDPVQVREMLDAVADDAPLELDARLGEGCVDLEFAMPQLEHGPSPLLAVAASLKQYSGTAVEALAIGQVLLERQGGAVRGEDGRVVIRLPLSEAG